MLCAGLGLDDAHAARTSFPPSQHKPYEKKDREKGGE